MSTPTALVAGRYRLVKMLGAGGMGVVWQAWDDRLHRPVALKMLRTQPELTDAERQLATDRALREARIAAGLHHPHVVTVFDVVEHEGQPCIVMQLVDSTPLSELLREHGPLSPSETARIGAQVASALDAAHRLKIVHRDVKPGNVLITADGSAMISDFGISHALGDATITATGLIHGTPAYLAPEVARGLPTSFASDVFSLGSTLYATVEGEPPFGTDRNSIALLHRVARGEYVSPERAGPIAPLLAAMLSPEPKRRPSMASIVESLSAIESTTGAVAAVAAAARLPEDEIETAVTDAEADTAVTDAEADASGEQAPPTPATVHLDPPTPGIDTELAGDEPPPRRPPTPATIRLDPPNPPAATAATVATAATAALPAGRTVPMDQPTSYQPPTAETEPVGGARAPAAAAPTDVLEPTDRGAPATADPRRRRRRIALVALILVVLVAAGVVAALLLNPIGREVEGGAEPTPAQSRSASAAAETPPPDESAAAPTPSTPPAEEESPAPAPVTPEQRVIDSISNYYALMPEQRDAAWPLMTADYQENHAGGRAGYEAFWSEVADVAIADVSATSADSGQATLTYYFSDGNVTEEVTAFRFVDEAGVLKIAATDVLSSRSL